MSITKIKDVPRYKFCNTDHGIIMMDVGRVPYLRFYIKENGEKTKFEDTKIVNKFAILIEEGKYKGKFFIYNYFCIDKDENKLELKCRFLDPNMAERTSTTGIDEEFYKVATAIMFDLIGKQEDLLEAESSKEK